MVYEGLLFGFAGTGTEGFHWSLQQKDGDELEILDADGKVVVGYA